MPIERKDDGTIVITGKNSIRLYNLLAWKHALKLELLGLRRRGPSIYQIAKRELGFKGSKKQVLEQLETYIAEKYPTPESAQ